MGNKRKLILSLAPSVFESYYKKALTKNYDLLVAPSGNGYIYPSYIPKDYLPIYTKNLNTYMGDISEYSTLIIDNSSFYNLDLWYNFTKESNIRGIFYIDSSPYNKYEGEIIWSNNKPIISCRDFLLDETFNEYILINNIKKRLDLGYTDVNSHKSYTFVYVNPYIYDLYKMDTIINNLKNIPNIEVVTPNKFLDLINKNIKREL